MNKTRQKTKASAKPKLAKYSTMKETMKASATLLQGTNIDSDAKTRDQSKKIQELTTLPISKPKLAKHGTMLATAKVNIETY